MDLLSGGKPAYSAWEKRVIDLGRMCRLRYMVPFKYRCNRFMPIKWDPFRSFINCHNLFTARNTWSSDYSCILKSTCETLMLSTIWKKGLSCCDNWRSTTIGVNKGLGPSIFAKVCKSRFYYTILLWRAGPWDSITLAYFVSVPIPLHMAKS